MLLVSALGGKMQSGREFVSLKEIAEERKLSLAYLSQIILPLKKAGLVKSKEGRDGGYCLAKSPREITVMQVLEVLEGPVAPVRCCSNSGAKCGSQPYCNVQSTWQDAQGMLTNFLQTKTLEDIVMTNKVPDSNSHVGH